MNNKETLQNYNSKLDTNNNELASILETINNLPESGGSFGSDYVQDGLIGYFDARDDFDSNNHWLNKVGSDYFKQCYPNTPEIIERMKSLKTSDTIVNDGSFSMINTVDYCKSGYTFELVGIEKDGNTDFLTFDRNQTPEICIGKYGTSIFSPINCSNGINQLETKIDGLTQKRCTMVLHLKKVFNRGVSSGRVILMYSVNGSPWSVWGLRDLTSASSYKTFGTMLMSYYSTGAGGSVCEVNCLRIYNRLLSNEELKHNHEIDKINFNLDE